MPFFDSVRSFFGLPHIDSGRPSNPPWDFNFNDDHDEEDDEQDEDLFHHMRPGRDFGFRMFSGDMLELHRFFEQQFDEMLKSFHSGNWFSDGFGHHGGMLMPPKDEETIIPDHSSPRSKFLKPSYVHPPTSGSFPEIDSEEMDSVSPSRILDLFPDKGEKKENSDQRIQAVQPFSASSRVTFSSQVVKKKILPNGGVEIERKCVRDGKEETSVSRQIGDMKHTLTRTKQPDGTTETHEEFLNMNEGDLNDFNKAWGTSPESNPSHIEPGFHGLSKNPSLLDILKDIFQ